jgi:hypothetical protein
MAINADNRDELKGYLTYTTLMLKGALSFSKTLITNASDVVKLRQTRPGENHYTRPPRAYDIPPYSPEMKFCRSNEKYLRPTRLCNPWEPEVIALAHKLGSYQKSDYEFALEAFEFTKEKMYLEILPLDGVAETIRRGTGTCFQLISVFIALCRAAGIKARYKMYAQNMIQTWREAMIDVDPLAKKWYDSLGYFVIEGEGEAYIDGRWQVAHVGPTAERQAAAGIPITHFGEDALGVWFFARPGTIMRLESVPPGLARASKLLYRIAPGSLERINISIINQTRRGKEIIEAAGGVQAYDKRIRDSAGPKIPKVELRKRDEIVFME